MYQTIKLTHTGTALGRQMSVQRKQKSVSKEKSGEKTTSNSDKKRQDQKFRKGLINGIDSVVRKKQERAARKLYRC